MLEYAAADVIHLERLRNLLAGELERLGRMAWARAKFAQCEKKRFEEDDRPLFARVKKARELCDGRDLAVLSELAKVRDHIAMELDLPSFMIMADPVLISLARDRPRTVHELSVRRGMHPECKRRYAERLVGAIALGLASPGIKWPRPKPCERNASYSQAVFDALKAWRADYAKGLEVEPDLILSLNSLRRLASGTAIDEVLREEAVGAWRFEEIKRALKKIIKEPIL
jgi:ribonuclease D